MEMELVHLKNDSNSTEEPSFEQLVLPSSSPEISGISGDPQVYPRVGEEYQAEISPMISETEPFQLLLNPCDSEGITLGLPIPVTWVCNKINATKDEGCRRNNPDNSANASRSSKTRASRKNNSLKKGSKHNIERQNLGMDDEQESKPSNFGTEVAVNADSSWLHKNKEYDLVPGLFDHTWTEAEVNCFILGLYIFGKNFVQIKRFLGKKEMGHILSFYYGEFYRSDGYRRWSGCQRTKRKKCIYGHKLFTGWRQQELLSRLHPHVPEHSQNAFLEVSTAFSEGKFSLEDYVLNLKAIVGIQALVEAIGIGKGKSDLTSLAMEPSKSNPLFTVCPIGKACSSLTCSDIIKLLSGGFRLSKARCNDIFWEAVWPRLVARGWHSEQPKNQSYMGPNHSLVFLIPGVKKFSKRKLVKGNDYFDSVSDVLSKVASEPKLIELEDEEARSSCNEEGRCAVDVPLEQDNPSIRQTHQYLKPRVSNLELARFTVVDSGLVNRGKLFNMRQMRYAPSDLKVNSFTTLSSSIEIIFSDNLANNNDQIFVDMSLDGGRNINNVDCWEKASDDWGSNYTEFTIVDTSLICARSSSKVRELRYSLVDVKVTSEMNNSSRKKEGYSPEDSLHVRVQKATNKQLNKERNACKSNHNPEATDGRGSEQKFLNQDTRNKLVESLQDNGNVSSKDQSTRTIKHKFSRRSKSGHSNNLVPVVKRRKLTACSNTDISRAIKNFSVGLESKQERSCYPLNLPGGGSNSFQGNSLQTSSLTTSLCGGCVEESSRSMSEATCVGTETSHGRNVIHQTPSLIDLNLPQVRVVSENEEPALMEVESMEAASTHNACFLFNSDKPDSEGEALSASADASPVAEQSNVNSRRQSTRKRPLTTKALEAIEFGLMGMKRQ